MKLITITLIIGLFFSNISFADVGRKELRELENKFINEKNFNLIHKHQNVPEDVSSWLMKITRSKNIANYGEAYNKTDLVDAKYPRSQHQYTLLNKKVSATLIKTGGLGAIQWLLLVDRENPNIACTYSVKWDLEFSESLQYIIRNKRELYKSYLQGAPSCRMVKK